MTELLRRIFRPIPPGQLVQNPLSNAYVPQDEQAGADSANAVASASDGTEPVDLPTGPAAAVQATPVPVALEDMTQNAAQTEPVIPKPKTNFSGLLDLPELVTFMEQNFFGFGFNAGATRRTVDSMNMGKREIVSRFKNLIEQIKDRKYAQLTRHELSRIEINGLSPVTQEKLAAAASKLQRDIGIFDQQIELADAHQGWIADAINRYESGFLKGVADAIDFDILSN